MSQLLSVPPQAHKLRYLFHNFPLHLPKGSNLPTPTPLPRGWSVAGGGLLRCLLNDNRSSAGVAQGTKSARSNRGTLLFDNEMPVNGTPIGVREAILGMPDGFTQALAGGRQLTQSQRERLVSNAFPLRSMGLVLSRLFGGGGGGGE